MDIVGKFKTERHGAALGPQPNADGFLFTHLPAAMRAGREWRGPQHGKAATQRGLPSLNAA